MLNAALFGGSFNPIHVGHLMVAEGALDALKLDRVVFVPAGSPPHKSGRELASAEDRLRMVELAIGDHPRFEVWDHEARGEGPAYTIDTVRAWKALTGATGRVPFLIGADTVRDLATWRCVAELFGEALFVPFPRPGFPLEAPDALWASAPRDEVRAMLARGVTTPLVDVSASDIRRRVAEGRGIRYLTPQLVAEYIRRHDLYARNARGRSAAT